LKNQVHLLFSRRFLPLFTTQFLGAFNDNLFKNALVIMIMYAGLQMWGVSSGVLVVAAGGIFILPFFLFSSLAGQLADKYEKSAIIRLVKVWEILLMLLAAVGFYTMTPGLLLAVLFLMGTQSTFFGPIKYSILPDHLERGELIAGNALIEAATFVAILLGTIGGGLLIAVEGGATVVSTALLIVAAAGLGASLFIPKAPAPAADLRVGWNILAQSWKIISISRSSRPVFLSILGISWFWLIGAVFLSTLPVYVRVTVEGTEGVVTWFLTMFSVGTGLGSLLCNKLLKGEIDTRYVPLGAFGMTLFGLDLCLASLGLPMPLEGAPAPVAPTTVAQLLSHLVGWRISLDLFLIAACGGLFIVPLYAVMQTRCREEERARVIAANNIMNALFMVVSAGGAAAMIGAGLGPVVVFLVVCLLNGGAYFVIRSLALESGDRPVLRLLLKIILRAMYQIRIRGVEHVAAAGGNVMVVANHQSFLDGVLMGVFFPGRYSFVVNRFMAGRWWARLFLSLVDTHTLDAENPMAIKKLVKILRAGGRIIIFPEGRITITGALMKTHMGPALIAQKSGASILPVRIEGAHLTHFSRMTAKVKPRFFNRITVTVLPPRALDTAPGLEGRMRRDAARGALTGIMREMMFDGADTRRTIPAAVLDAAAIFGAGHAVMSEHGHHDLVMTYGQLIDHYARLGASLVENAKEARFLGVMLPNSVDAVSVILGIQAAGAAAAVMKSDWDTETALAAARAAGLTTVVMSRAQAPKAMELEKAGVNAVFIEDLKANPYRGFVFNPGVDANPDSPAAAFYSTDSDGGGEWAAHSHAGLLANAYQLAAVMDFGPVDIVLSAQPLSSHPGLLLGMVAPLLLGMQSSQHHSLPPHSTAPTAVYDSNATIVFGDWELLEGMGRMGHPYDFANVRRFLAVGPPGEADVEWKAKLGRLPLSLFGDEWMGIVWGETPMYIKQGAAGILLPGARIREGNRADGMMEVCSPGAALGRLDPVGDIIGSPGGWLGAGVTGRLDGEGFVLIEKRA